MPIPRPRLLTIQDPIEAPPGGGGGGDDGGDAVEFHESRRHVTFHIS